MKKWSLILLLWYIFVDNTPWIQEVDKKTVWILKPGWSTEKHCREVKAKIFEILDGENKKYMCIDMDNDNPLPDKDLKILSDHLKANPTIRISPRK